MSSSNTSKFQVPVTHFNDHAMILCFSSPLTYIWSQALGMGTNGPFPKCPASPNRTLLLIWLLRYRSFVFTGFCQSLYSIPNSIVHLIGPFFSNRSHHVSVLAHKLSVLSICPAPGTCYGFLGIHHVERYLFLFDSLEFTIILYYDSEHISAKALTFFPLLESTFWWSSYL